jgi:hypothetical protein
VKLDDRDLQRRVRDRPHLVDVGLDLDGLTVKLGMLVHDDAHEIAVFDDELLAQVAEADRLLSHEDPFYTSPP